VSVQARHLYVVVFFSSYFSIVIGCFSVFNGQFSGTGHRLTSGQAAPATPFGASTGGGWLGGAFSSTSTTTAASSSSAGAATAATDRETMAARRLAALAGRSDREQQEHLLAEGTGTGTGTGPADLQKLQVSRRSYGSVASTTTMTGNAVRDREAIAARRIAALGGSSSQDNSGSGNEAT
jgi:hypothetical protein